MIALMRKLFQVLLQAVLVITIFGSWSTAGAATLTNVNVTPDLRRIVIESSGSIGAYNTFELDRPPRLVIDVKGLRPGNKPKMVPAERTGGLKIQVSESRDGSHVVLDFGGSPVPSHRIRRMNNYLLVFLGDWRAPRASATPETAPHSAARVKPAQKAPPKRNPRRTRSPQRVSKASNLTIEAARVIDGLIVLNVADRANPDRLFQVKLGVNLERPGFVSAGIIPLKVNGRSTGLVTQAENSGQGHGEKASSGGPRKTAGPSAVERVQSRQHSPARQLGPVSGKRREAQGPTRSPRRVGPVGPVSLIDKEACGWRRNSFPVQSVSKTARAILQAYRRSPLLRFATCAFSPAGKSGDSSDASRSSER